MSRVDYKHGLRWIIAKENMDWIKAEKPDETAPLTVLLITEMYRVELARTIRTIRNLMGLDQKPEVVKEPKAPKVKAEKKAKPVKLNKAQRQAAMKKPEIAPAEVAQKPEADKPPMTIVETPSEPEIAPEPKSETVGIETADVLNFEVPAFLTKNKA